MRVVEAGECVPNILSLALPGPPAEVWLHHLEELGVYVSVGSACQSNTGADHSVLGALGLDESQARQVMRLSFSGLLEADAGERAVTALRDVAEQLKSLC